MTKSVSSLVLLGGGVVLVGLALYNWQANGWAAMIWLFCFIAQLAIRMPFAVKTKQNAITTTRRDTSERIVLAAMFLAMMIAPLVHLATGAFAFADYVLPGWMGVVGALVQVPFLWLFWRSHADLGVNWSPGLELRTDHRLVTSGVYARIRHPMYAALWLSALAQPLLVQNWIAGVLAIPAIAAIWIVRLPLEEAMMQQEFGAEYDDYCRRVGRLWPRFGP